MFLLITNIRLTKKLCRFHVVSRNIWKLWTRLTCNMWLCNSITFRQAISSPLKPPLACCASVNHRSLELWLAVWDVHFLTLYWLPHHQGAHLTSEKRQIDNNIISHQSKWCVPTLKPLESQMGVSAEWTIITPVSKLLMRINLLVCVSMTLCAYLTYSIKLLIILLLLLMLFLFSQRPRGIIARLYRVGYYFCTNAIQLSVSIYLGNEPKFIIVGEFWTEI